VVGQQPGQPGPQQRGVLGDYHSHASCLHRQYGRDYGRAAEILALFTGQQDLTASDIAQATDLSRAMTNRHLARLVTEGRLIATTPPASRNRAYRLPPNAP
jgi:Fic family protein